MATAKKKIEECSCDESSHLRRALLEIKRIATTNTHVGLADDLAQIGNLAHQGLHLEALVGDLAVPGTIRTRG